VEKWDPGLFCSVPIETENSEESTPRFPQFICGSGSARASPHSAPTVLSSSTLASSLSRLGSKDPSSSFTVTSPTVVDKQEECDERSISVSYELRVLEQQNSLTEGYKCFLWWKNETQVCSVVFP
jgi:hypothetical protein